MGMPHELHGLKLNQVHSERHCPNDKRAADRSVVGGDDCFCFSNGKTEPLVPMNQYKNPVSISNSSFFYI